MRPGTPTGKNKATAAQCSVEPDSGFNVLSIESFLSLVTAIPSSVLVYGVTSYNYDGWFHFLCSLLGVVDA